MSDKQEKDTKVNIAEVKQRIIGECSSDIVKVLEKHNCRLEVGVQVMQTGITPIINVVPNI